MFKTAHGLVPLLLLVACFPQGSCAITHIVGFSCHSVSDE